MSNHEGTEVTWEAPCANVRVGSLVKVSLSDAPEFAGRVTDIDFETLMLTVARPGRKDILVDEIRITAVALEG